MEILKDSPICDEDWDLLTKAFNKFFQENNVGEIDQVIRELLIEGKENESERVNLSETIYVCRGFYFDNDFSSYPLQWEKIQLPVGPGLQFSSNREFLKECSITTGLEERIADALMPCERCKGFNETKVDDYIEKNYSQEDFLQELDQTIYIIPEEIIQDGRDDVIWLANIEICKCPEFGYCDSCCQTPLWSEPDCCTICKQFYFCEKCVRDYTAYGSLLECSECSNNLVENLSEYDESVEHEQIGYREGDRDIYDNRDDY